MTFPPLDIVDTHAHLDDPAFDADRDEVVARAASVGVRRIVNVGYCPERWATTRALADAHRNVHAMYGLHPQDADRYSEQTLAALDRELRAGGAVAVGEIGLDFARDGVNRDTQREAFVAQIAVARRHGLPIVIHQRAAEAELRDVLTSEPDLPPVLLHSFDGTRQLAGLAVERGWLVGVGGLATKPARQDLRDVLATVPLTSVMLETDAPYLVPADMRNRRNEPANLATAVGRLAGIWGVSPEHLAAVSTATAERFFGIGPVAVPRSWHHGPEGAK